MPSNEFGQLVGEPVRVAKPELPARRMLSGRFCELQPLDSAAHGEQLFREYCAVEDHSDWTYLPYGPFGSFDDFLAWLRRVEGKDDPIFFTVVDRKSGQCAGLASYLRIDRYAASIEVGHIHLARSIQGSPVSTEAMYLMMRHAFDAGYRRYEWKCDDLNAPSRAAALRLGFVFEGVFRQATHYKGRNRDTAWYGIVDRDWVALRAEFERWLDPANFDGHGYQLTPLRNRQ